MECNLVIGAVHDQRFGDKIEEGFTRFLNEIAEDVRLHMERVGISVLYKEVIDPHHFVDHLARIRNENYRTVVGILIYNKDLKRFITDSIATIGFSFRNANFILVDADYGAVDVVKIRRSSVTHTGELQVRQSSLFLGSWVTDAKESKSVRLSIQRLIRSSYMNFNRGSYVSRSSREHVIPERPDRVEEVIEIGEPEMPISHLATLVEALTKKLSEKFPNVELELASVQHDRVIVNFKYTNVAEVGRLREEIVRLRTVVKETSKRVEHYKLMIMEKEKTINELLLSAITGKNPQDSREMAILFLDIQGFSGMNDAEKETLCSYLWHAARLISESEGIDIANTWGDAVMFGVGAPAPAVKIAFRLLKSMQAHGHFARIGISWGWVKVAYNPLRGKHDLVGHSVDEAARLEPLLKNIGEAGTVAVSESFINLPEFLEYHHLWMSKTIKIEKGWADKSPGDEVTVYIARDPENF